VKDGNGNGIGDGEFLFGIEWSWSLSGLKSVIAGVNAWLWREHDPV